MTAVVVAAIALCGSLLTAALSLRGQLSQAKIATDAGNRDDFWKLLDERNKELAEIKASYEQVHALYLQQAQRLEALESQRIKDQVRIQDLEQRIKSLGGTI